MVLTTRKAFGSSNRRAGWVTRARGGRLLGEKSVCPNFSYSCVVVMHGTIAPISCSDLPCSYERSRSLCVSCEIEDNASKCSLNLTGFQKVRTKRVAWAPVDEANASSSCPSMQGNLKRKYSRHADVCILYCMIMRAV